MKNIPFFTAFTCLVIFLLLSGCQNNIEIAPNSSDVQPASFSVYQAPADSIATRANSMGFEPGDEIGIYVVKRTASGSELQSNSNYADNKHYIVDQSGNLKPANEEDRIYLSSSETYDFYAYYPYTESIDPLNYNFTVSLEQDKNKNYEGSDLMIAQNLTGTSGTGTISLCFQRKMALIELYFWREGANVSDISVTAQVGCNLNIGENLVITADNSRANVKARLYEDSGHYYVFRAILPAQELRKEYLFTCTVNGKPVYYKAAMTTLNQGVLSIYFFSMQYKIRAYERDAGTGYVEGAAEKEKIYNIGENVHLKAISSENYYFDGWYESPFIGWQTNLPKISDQPDLYFTATKSAEYIALFLPKMWRLNTTCITEGGGDGGFILGGNADYVQGDKVVVSAKPYSDFVFLGWYENNILVSSDPNYEFIMPARTVNLEGRFQSKIVTIKIECSPAKEVLAPYYDKPAQIIRNYGSEPITLYGYILTDCPYLFTGWYEDGIYLNRDYAYTFSPLRDRTLLAKYCLRAFSLSASGGYITIDQPGEFTRTFTNKNSNHPTYLRAGQKLQQISNLYYQDLVQEHTSPILITEKKLIIKLGDQVILETNNFEDLVFTAPGSGTYTFNYSITMRGTFKPGEKTAGSLNISRTAWYLD